MTTGKPAAMKRLRVCRSPPTRARAAKSVVSATKATISAGLTFLSYSPGLKKAAVSRWSPGQPQKESAMERLAGPQLLNFWYSWRMPVSKAWAGRGVGVVVAVGEGRGVCVRPGAVEVGVGLAAGEGVSAC